MYVVTVDFIIKPAHLAEFLPAMMENAKTSLEVEPECTYFDVCQSESKSNHIFLYEIYNSEKAFQDHLASEHFKLFSQTVENWVESKAVNIFNRC
ncbi:hypothetical protein DS2_15619 [Catenovulum agarivorans DS-2]|uniref:ABM domain-containing protein n=1 Tax=Catenovulum agarivorans DS-2 TaxID=1328313 RepID=W7QTS3_9ALTE|nr:putative quinol monooxygenase [Catenovulum agarivorans]EWH08830.1 hypothetical protein DS2_15619 [Catenovulum agarivorans DS-2]